MQTQDADNESIVIAFILLFSALHVYKILDRYLNVWLYNHIIHPHVDELSKLWALYIHFSFISSTDNTEFLKQSQSGKLERNKINPDSAFCLLLKHTTNIPVAPKSTLDIPLTFAPDNMNLHEALCVVSVRRENGETWKYQVPRDPDHPHARR